MKDEKISVIVCIYNVAEYMERCVNSVLNQTYTNTEILLVDDGSTDDCAKFCDAYAARDKRIQVIHQKNAGLSAARNTGIEHAHGKYLTFIDGDDFIHQEMIAILYHNLLDYHADISTCSFQMVIPNEVIDNTVTNHVIIQCGNEMLKKLYHKETFEETIVTWNKLYKSILFHDVRFPLGKLHEDNYITPVVLLKAKRIAISDSVLYFYVQRPNSIIHSEENVIQKELDILLAFEQNLILFNMHGEKQLVELATNRYLYGIIHVYEFYSQEKKDNRDNLKKMNILFSNAYRSYIRKKKFPIVKKMNLFLFLRFKPAFFFMRLMKKKINTSKGN